MEDKMTLRARIKYAQVIGGKYGQIPAIENLTGQEVTAYEVVSAAFDKSIIRQWLIDEKEETKRLRRKFGFEPIDKFDKETDAEIEKLG